MTEVVVVGGGFAGVWTALGAVRTRVLAERDDADLRVTLVAPNDDLVIRPRLYEDNPERFRVPLNRTLGPVGVRRVAATVTQIDTQAKQVSGIDRYGDELTLGYDRLVLAAGSRLIAPQVAGAEHLFDADSMPAAAALHAHLARLPQQPDSPGRFTAVVVGAGFTGVEVATELPARLAAVADGAPVRVILLERGDEVAGPLGAGPRPHIQSALDELGVEVRLGASVSEVTADAVVLEDGETIPTSTVVWTVGMTASPLTAQVPGERDQLGRLVVDKHLKVPGVDGVYAAGDTAAAPLDDGNVVMQCCQHAVPQGKFAGVNAAAEVLGLEAVPFAPDPYVTCLDLGPAGAVFSTGWDREVQLTGEEAKAVKSDINALWIYPPVDDRDLILHRADHRKTWPIDEVTAVDKADYSLDKRAQLACGTLRR